MAKWTYESILDHEGYKTSLEKVNAIVSEIETIQEDMIPKLEEKAEKLKRESLESDQTTWQDVEQVRHEIEQCEYRISVLKERRKEQQKEANEQAEKARREIVQEAEQRKIESLQKSLRAYELLKEAYDDNEEVNRHQRQALQLSGRDFTKVKAKIPVEVPNPSVQNVVWDLWLKQTRKFLKSKGVLETN